MAYDTNRAETVMTGGQFLAATDAWHFTPTNWVQDGTQPTDALQDDLRVLAEDRANQKLVAFGGADEGGSGTLNNRTYLRNSSGVWSATSPTTPPTARAGGAFAYCPALGMPIHFGGTTGGSSYSALTHAYNGATNTWTNLAPATSPPARMLHAMCTFGTGVLLFGGWKNPGPEVLYNDAWFFDGTTWSDITPVVSPAARYFHGMAYYETVTKAVVFGGYLSGPVGTNETWSLDLSSGLWTQEAPSASPAARFGAPLSWEPTLAGVLLFGGDTGGIGGEQQDTWLFQYAGITPVASTAAIRAVIGLD